MTLIASPLASPGVVKVFWFNPTVVPFNFHWYDGFVPPLVGVAVKVTEVPWQMSLSGSLETMVTLTGLLALTVVVISLLVAGLPVGQGKMFEVRTTFTRSPFLRLEVVKVF